MREENKDIFLVTIFERLDPVVPEAPSNPKTFSYTILYISIS